VEFLLRILRAELERRQEVKKLYQEMERIIETQGEECHVDRINEILSELGVVDPLLHEDDGENGYIMVDFEPYFKKHGETLFSLPASRRSRVRH